MAKFYYFAYGSNMLTEWVKSRCPSAVPVGIAEIIGFSVEFSKRSIDGSGKATLNQSNLDSFGVVFEIESSDLADLDDHEGKRGGGYYRDDNFPVRLVGGNAIHASAYLASKPEAHLKPYDWYLALVIAGGREHNLNPDYVARFRQAGYEFDHDKDRDTRKRATEALARSGFPEYRRILSGE
jgi:gamma-glutamylcyclotransferase